VTDKLRETLYTVVGFGVLGVQQAQVRRRDLQKSLARLAAEVDERVDPVLDELETRVPDEARPLVVGARSAARGLERALFGPRPPLT
jgi:phosphate uptake regulator